ncbi:MAG: heme peroxidase [Phycisphaerales bacterium]|nr:heme peroxidase [Phycisphaerales bacterium]
MRSTYWIIRAHTPSTHAARNRSKRRDSPTRGFSVVEALETRVHFSSTVESANGSGNNVANPTWGTSGTDLIRLAAAAYANGVNSPALAGDLSARAISNLLNNQANPADPSQDVQTVDAKSLSDFGYAFGQFIDHDLDHTPDGGASFPIPVATGDPIGPSSLPFTRSQTDPTTGTSTANPLQQVTTVTSYLDLSQVYGSSQTVADALRTFKGGLLKTSPGNMLPYDNTTYFTAAQIAALNMANDAQAVPQSQLFATGDVRGNENVELTALQTLFLRNHNRIAQTLQKAHPKWTDEQLYQEARKLNIAQYQSNVYNGWIPAVLGGNALPAYSGYKPGVNATISNEFATVAFRFGHSLLSSNIERATNQGTDIADVNPDGSAIPLSLDFFDPNILNPKGVLDPLTGHTSSDIGAILKGDADGVSQATDLLAINDVRNLLFGNGGLGGEDLMARDVQRDRDNGIPNYNTLRVAMGLPAVTSFSQITTDVKVQQALAQAYPGGVNTIDAFEGGLAEDHVRGSDVGPLFQAVMVDQFTRLRNGDRFYYRNEHLSTEEQNILRQGNTLAKVIEANTTITNLQSDVFYFRASISGTVMVGLPTGTSPGAVPGGSFDSMPQMTLQLQDMSGDVLATTKTDGRGHYQFNQLSGPAGNPNLASGVSAVGEYKVVLVLPSGMRQTSPSLSPVVVASGDTNVQGENFTVSLPLVHHHGWLAVAP